MVGLESIDDSESAKRDQELLVRFGEVHRPAGSPIGRADAALTVDPAGEVKLVTLVAALGLVCGKGDRQRQQQPEGGRPTQADPSAVDPAAARVCRGRGCD